MVLRRIKIRTVIGDITKITDVQAIVNAVNSSLLGETVLTGQSTGRRGRSCFPSAGCLDKYISSLLTFFRSRHNIKKAKGIDGAQ